MNPRCTEGSGRAALAAGLLLVMFTAPVNAASCTQALVQRADEAADHIGSGAALSRWRARYLACDEAGIAEGVSEGVARLLIDQRSTLRAPPPFLVRPDLQKVVLRHVTATLATNDLESIARIREVDCAASLAAFCRKLGATAAAALKDSP
jgi:hypothetical protein